MFSRRGSPEQHPNRIAEAIAALPDRSSLLDLTESNPTAAELEGPFADALEVLGRVRPSRYAPDPLGLPEARGALAAYLHGSGRPVAATRLVLTTSTSEAYAFLLKLLCDPGDEVLVPRPSYPLLDHLCRLEAVKAVDYHLRYDGRFFVDLASVERAIHERTRAIVVINPNNPTGNYLDAETLSALGDFGLPLISDEVFFEHGAGGARGVSALGTSDAPAFVLGGLSKLLGLPQVKLSWIAVGGGSQVAAQSLERLGLIADTYLSVPTATQLALPGLLELQPALGGAIGRRLEANERWLRAALGSCPSADLLPREGGFYAVLRVPEIMDEQDWVLRLLALDQVLVQPGFFYDFASGAHLVLSLLPRRDRFEEGVGRLLRRVDALSRG